jgi:hypothetical protein
LVCSTAQNSELTSQHSFDNTTNARTEGREYQFFGPCRSSRSSRFACCRVRMRLWRNFQVELDSWRRRCHVRGGDDGNCRRALGRWDECRRRISFRAQCLRWTLRWSYPGGEREKSRLDVGFMMKSLSRSLRELNEVYCVARRLEVFSLDFGWIWGSSAEAWVLSYSTSHMSWILESLPQHSILPVKTANYSMTSPQN